LRTRAVLKFFETASRNIRAAEEASKVGHHVAQSAVGTDRLQASGYFRAKLAQEKLIQGASVPYAIVPAMQGSTVRVSRAMMQPIAADGVAAILAHIAAGAALGGVIDIAAPQPICMDDPARPCAVTCAAWPREVHFFSSQIVLPLRGSDRCVPQPRPRFVRYNSPLFRSCSSSSSRSPSGNQP